MSADANLSKPPWEIAQFISFRLPLHLQMQQVQEGWKECPHDELIAMKNKISQVESQEEWELWKKITNPYEAIFSGSDDSQFPSLAKVQPLSRSYFKMIEMLQICKFWESWEFWQSCQTSQTEKNKPFISAHVCEGPGGFLQCIVEQAKRLTTPKSKGFYAMTLRPTKSHIPGWRRSIQFLRKHPQIHIEYGEDNTGNVLKRNNQYVFSKKAAGANIFTADGGFDFSIDYSKQEELAFPLILASFTMGLQCLAKGGTMIIKIFDMYSAATQDLLIGTATLFQKFTIYKPATSRPCNAERYYIACGYVGTGTAGQGQGTAEECKCKALQWIRHLQESQWKHEQSPLTRLVKNEWPPAIQQAFNEQIAWQETQQQKTIQETLSFSKENLTTYMVRQLEMSRKWCKMFSVPIYAPFDQSSA